MFFPGVVISLFIMSANSLNDDDANVIILIQHCNLSAVHPWVRNCIIFFYWKIKRIILTLQCCSEDQK